MLSKRKASILAIALLLCVALIAGCGDSSGSTPQSQAPDSSVDSGSPSSAAPDVGGRTVVEFWSSMSGGMGETLDEVVAGYNESQDDVLVEVHFQGNYYDMAAKLQAGIASGETPHIAQLEMVRTKMFADYGILVNMTELVAEAGIDVNDFYEGLMTSCDYGEGLYALPFNRSTPMFYYNMEMFEEAGLDPSRGPSNWTELREYAQALSIPDERWGFEMPIDTWFYEAFIMQSGSDILNADETDIAFNNAAGTDPLYLWKDMMAEGSMKAPPGKEYNSYEAARQDFAAGVTGMIIVSSGDLATLTASCEFEFNTAFLPANTRYGVPTGGANVAMLEGHEEDHWATMDFLKYLTSPEVAAYWSVNTGYVPSRVAAAEHPIYQDFINNQHNAGTAVEQMQYTDIPRPVHRHFNEIHSVIIMNEIQRCMEEADYTPELAVQAISDQTRELLAS